MESEATRPTHVAAVQEGHALPPPAPAAADARRIPVRPETEGASLPGAVPPALPRPQSRPNNARTYATLTAVELMSRIDTHDMAMQTPMRGTQSILDLHYHQRMYVCVFAYASSV